MTFALPTLVALEDIFGRKAVAALGQSEKRRTHVALERLAWIGLLIAKGAPDDVIVGAVTALVSQMREVRAACRCKVRVEAVT